MRTAQIVIAPESYLNFNEGIKTIINVIKPTLGPSIRNVIIQDRQIQDTPEVLDDGGLIARRITSLADSNQNPGAMFIRQLLWQLRESVGDGTATAAIIFENVYQSGLRYILSGGNPALLRNVLEESLNTLIECFESTVYEFKPNRELLQRIIYSICGDDQLAIRIAEIYESLDNQGFIELHKAEGSSDAHEFIEGSFWDGGLMSPKFMLNPWIMRSEMIDGGLILTDLELNDPSELVNLLNIVENKTPNGICIVAQKVAESVVSFFSQINKHDSGFKIICVKTPGNSIQEQFANLQDLSIITGGKLYLREGGMSLININDGDIGLARKIWADKDYFGIVSGKGDVIKIKQHIYKIERNLENLEEDSITANNLRHRIGRIKGGIARLMVGGMNKTDKNFRYQKAEKAVNILPLIERGIVAGGGVALLKCAAEYKKRKEGNLRSELERVVDNILVESLQKPTRIILENSGREIRQFPEDLTYPFGIDALDGNPKNFIESGIIDSAEVIKAALVSAIKGAALALSIGAVIFPKNPKLSVNP